MKISRRWLSDFLPSPETLPDDGGLAALLTGRGIEIESVRSLSSRGLLAGEIVSVRPHPGAARLRVCEVNTGKKKTAQIVCGAPNAESGFLAVLAPPGASVGGAPMRAREIRGVRSEGMLCGADELGIGAADDGIIVLDAGETEPGMPLDDYLQLPDSVFDAGITPNRGDCLSHLGVAREIAAASGMRLSSPEETHDGAGEIFPAEIDSAALHACPYYCCVAVRGLDAGRVSPWWLRARLARRGIRAINAAADITNYVLAAIGQPLHAFDLDKLDGVVRVRMADAGETLQLLDGKTVRCESDTVLIAGGKKAAAMGGVMGGAESAVGAATKNILLEGAFFSPAAVRGKTARHGLVSEAAFHYERGVDPTLPPRALAMAARLLREICGGTAGPLHCVGAPPPPGAKISISGGGMRGLIGVSDIGAGEAAKSLSALGIRAEAAGDEISAAPPPWRFDLEYPADLAEEIIRARGYDKLPEAPPPGGINPARMPPCPFSAEASRRRFVSLGFTEIITYAFVPPEWEEILQSGRGAPVALKNPISQEMSVMRTTLLGGLLDRALFNLNRRQENMRLFEIGRCFIPAKTEGRWEEEQPLYAAGVAFGGAAPAQWGVAGREGDFFDLKGWLEAFLRPAPNLRFTDDSPRPRFLHPQRSANILADIGGKPEIIGAAGVLHPSAASRFGFRRPPLAFELRLQRLLELRRLPKASALSRFPPVRRDLSVVSSAPAGAVLECVRRAAGLAEGGVSLFDVYENDNIGRGKKCYGVRLAMQGTDGNLTETDIRRTVSAVVEALAAAGMELRQ